MRQIPTSEKTVKTGISIDAGLARAADAMARELGVTRSGLYAMALREMLQRHETASMREKLDSVYGEGPDPEDEPLLEGIKRQGRRLLAEDGR